MGDRNAVSQQQSFWVSAENIMMPMITQTYPNMTNRRRAFTLVETLVAGLLFTIIVTATYTSYRVGMDSYRECETRLKQSQEAEIIHKYLSRDFQSAMIDPENEMVFFRAEPRSNDDTLWVLQLFNPEETFDFGDNILGSACLVEYSLKWSNPSCTSMALYRKLSCVIDDRTIAESEPVVVSDSIQSFRVLFLSPDDKWRDSWNSANALPRAMKVNVKLAAQNNVTQSNSYFFVNLVGGEENQ
jgi:hypothetical protein